MHFLLTRFNLKVGRKKTKKDIPIDEGWLENRFMLFDKYCYPSVKNQINQNFKWLVFFNVETPVKYIKKIEKYKNDYVNFIPIFTMETAVKSTCENISKLLHDGTTHIITSRLDNDDAIHKDYINKIQDCFSDQDFCIIDIIYGYVYSIRPKRELAIRRKYSNPFISLIESSDNFVTILSRKHTEWASEERKITIKDKLWLQVIHKYNVSNTMNTKIIKYLNRYNILKEFNILETDSDASIKGDFNIIRKNTSIKTKNLIKAVKRKFNHFQ